MQAPNEDERMNPTQVIFADGLMEATVNHGVARLVLAQVGTEGKPFPVGQLCVPLAQLPGLVNGLMGLLKQIEARVKDNAAGAAPAPAVPEPMPSAFTFGGR
jgi:hypothetical protein